MDGTENMAVFCLLTKRGQIAFQGCALQEVVDILVQFILAFCNWMGQENGNKLQKHFKCIMLIVCSMQH